MNENPSEKIPINPSEIQKLPNPEMIEPVDIPEESVESLQQKAKDAREESTKKLAELVKLRTELGLLNPPEASSDEPQNEHEIAERKKWGLAPKIEMIEGGTEGLRKKFDEAETAFLSGGREAVIPLLGRLNNALIKLNKSESGTFYELAEWNPTGELTEQEFNELNLRRKKLSEATGLKSTTTGEVGYGKGKENELEKIPEIIPTKNEVMGAISKVEFLGEVTILREISDEKGLRLLDIRVKGEKSGETIEYLYSRKGIFPNSKNIQIETKLTTIEASYLQDGDFVSGGEIATFNYETGHWEYYI